MTKRKPQKTKIMETKNQNNTGNDKGKTGKLQPDNKAKNCPEDESDEVKRQTESIPGNQTDQPFTSGRTFEEATDPSKLSDL
jgi:hypothetical protein